LDDYKTGMTGMKIRKRQFDSLQQEVYLSLWRTYDRLKALEDELFSEWKITPQQYNVLRLLENAEPDGLPTLAISSRLISRAPDITRMLDRLEEREWVTRSRSDEDRRSVYVHITAAGKKLLREIAKPLKELHLRQVGHMKAADLKQLSDLLQQARQVHESESSEW
jgi:DNA-binding MarR family transcriptional regulator